MSKFFEGLLEKIKNVDKDDLGKWGLLALAGLAGLGANVFDQRKKDRMYKSELGKSIKEQAEKLLGGGGTEA